jgi:hypothetical protein
LYQGTGHLRSDLVHVSQKDARNIEEGFAPGLRNVNCLQDEKSESVSGTSATKIKVSLADKPAIEPECETKRVLLDPGYRIKQ